MRLQDDLLQIRSPGVNYYVLRDAEGLYLVDAGFVGGRSLLRRALRKHGWEDAPVVGIIATHGHLDHILNIGRLAEDTGAWIAAPRLDMDHYLGHPEYEGPARVAGALEAIGRPLFGFRPFTPTRLLDDGDVLDFWHGLRVAHLPGHTAGHSGLYCEKQKLLFSADLIASYGSLPRFPPAIFNSDAATMPASVRKALALDLEGILPNHADRSSPQTHLQRLRDLAAKKGILN